MIAAPPDLLVIGGLTIDRFADGFSAPGGSVLHIARALAPRGVRVAVITVTGPEPEAQAGLEELRELAVVLEAVEADATATFRHKDTAEGRQLTLECSGGRVGLTRSPLVTRAGLAMVAPVAGEVAGEDLSALEGIPFRAAIVQGLLRSLEEGSDVRPLPLRALGWPAIAALRRFDLLFASREDLVAESDDPRAQLRALREAFGTTSTLVVTDGIEGLWLDDPAVHHLPVPRRVESVSAVGAGDILAALLTVGAPGSDSALDLRANDAMRMVAEILEARAATGGR